MSFGKIFVVKNIGRVKTYFELGFGFEMQESREAFTNAFLRFSISKILVQTSSFQLEDFRYNNRETSLTTNS